MATPSLVVRAQTHKSRYRCGEYVKCHVHMHPMKFVQPYPSTSTLQRTSSGSRVGGTSAVPPAKEDSRPQAQSHVLYDTQRLYPDPLLQPQELTAAPLSSASPAVSVVDVSAQLVGCCFTDKSKITLPASCTDGLQLTPLRDAKHISDSIRELLTTPDAVGKNEAVWVLCASSTAQPVRDAPVALRVGEPLSFSILFCLPQDVALPTYRGQSVRVAFCVCIRVGWAVGALPGVIQTTSLRVPVRVGGAEYAVVQRVGSVPRMLRGSDAPNDDGTFVRMPARPSPAVCPPLLDALVPAVHGKVLSSLLSCVSSPHHKRSATYSAVERLGTTALASSSSGVAADESGRNAPSMDSEVYHLLKASSPPTDFVIRYKDVHIMNLLIESCVLCLGGYLRGCFVHNLANEVLSASNMRVGRVTMSVDCYEMTRAAYLTKGAGASAAPVPSSLTASASILPSVNVGFSTGDPNVVLNVTSLEEKEWYMFDTAQTPFEVCLAPSRYQQTVRTAVLSVEWVVRWKFWCVDATRVVNANGASGAPNGRRKLKDLYQELELPLVILPPQDGGWTSLRMGQPAFGSSA